ncbi:MAG: ABC transporter permease, partial [Tepidisphaeraceae bacterium]
MKGHGNFLKPENLLNILRQWSFIGIIAIGMTFVIISGGIDLSVGAMVALAGGLGVWTMNTAIRAASIKSDPFQSVLSNRLAGAFDAINVGGSERWGVAIAVLTVVLVAVICGLINGMLIAKGRVAPFIATLGGLAAYRSLALALADGGEFRSASRDIFPSIGAGGVSIPYSQLLLPYPVIAFFVIAAVASVVLNRTRYGRYVVAIGCNERSAIYSAINVDRIKLLTYTLLGFLCGVSAVLLSSRMNSVASSSTGNLYELDAIAAVVIGGTRMTGGHGTIFGTVVGVLILGVIGNMLNFLDVSPYLQGLVKGVIIIAAVLVQRIGRRSQT